MGNEAKFVLTAEDRTSPALQSISRGLQGMESQAMLATRALGALGVTFSAAAAVAMVKGTIDAADGFNDLSQKVGISVKNLAGWTLAANQSGTSIETVAKGIKGLSTYMVDHGNKLRAAGITATDANGAMIQLADIFKAMPDGVQKTALAVQLMGKAGMDMIPVMNLGSKGLAEAQEKAKEYGERMEKLAPHADKFNDELETLAFNSKAAAAGMMEDLVPAMGKFAEKMALAQKNGAGFFGSITTAMRTVGIAEMSLADLRDRAGTLSGNVSYLKDSGDSPVFGAKLQANRAELKIIQDEIRRRMDIDGGMLAPYATGTSLAAAKAGAGLLDKPSAKAVKTPKQLMIELGERNLRASRGAESASVDDDEEARLFGPRLNMLSLQNEKRHTDELERQREKYVEMADPLQKYRVELDEINKLRDAGLLSAGQAIEAQWKVNEAMDETAKKVLGIKEAGDDAFAGLTRVVEGWGNKAADTWADFVVDGKASFSDLINSMLKDIARLQAKNFFDKNTKDASDWLSGFLGKGIGNFFGSGGAPAASQGFGMAGDAGSLLGFAGGGYTGDGSRSGGLDGQGGFLAMMHPRESVIDHTKGGGGGGTTYIFNNDLRGASVEAVARLERLVASVNGSIERRAMGVMAQARVRGA